MEKIEALKVKLDQIFRDTKRCWTCSNGIITFLHVIAVIHVLREAGLDPELVVKTIRESVDENNRGWRDFDLEIPWTWYEKEENIGSYHPFKHFCMFTEEFIKLIQPLC